MQPWYRKSDDWWYFYEVKGGRRKATKLVKGAGRKVEAFDRWHELCVQPRAKVSTKSVKHKIDVYLDHVQATKAPGTYEQCRHYLQSFTDHTGNVCLLQPRHVTEWLASKRWADSTKAGAVQIIRTCFSWLTREGYLDRNPVAGAKGPEKRGREVIVSDETFEKILKHSRRDFRDIATFLRRTGCRPQEAMNARVRHLDLESRRIVFPASEAKGKRPRVIYLDDLALSLVEKRQHKMPEARLFVTASGAPWDRNKMRCRFRRLRDKVGGQYCAYHLRHTFATAALKRLDVASTAALMGHRSRLQYTRSKLRFSVCSRRMGSKVRIPRFFQIEL